MLHIFIDADACPVKPEVYRVAHRYKLGVTLVAGARMRIPDSDEITLRVLEQGMDVADDWIVEHLEANDIVITADIPLAARCIARGAYVLGHTGNHSQTIILALRLQLATCSLNCGSWVRLREGLGRLTNETVPASFRLSTRPSTRSGGR